MDLWQYWLTAIQQTLEVCAVHLHLGMGLAHTVMTLVLRSALLPLTWTWKTISSASSTVKVVPSM